MSPRAVNSAYQSARNAAGLRGKGNGGGGNGGGGGGGGALAAHTCQSQAVGRDYVRASLHPETAPFSWTEIWYDAVHRALKHMAPLTPRPPRSDEKGYDPFKDPDLELPMDLKSYGPHKLSK
eukprot:6192599-Pleurochrysis_carterae.AAC.1